MDYLANINLNKNQLLNAVVQNLASAPPNPVEGQVYYNTITHREYYYNGTEWVAKDALGASMTGSSIVAAINESASIIDADNLPTSVSNAVTNSHAHSNKTTLDATTASYTTAEKSKLTSIETNADVTDAGNVGTAIYGTTAKTTLGDADQIAIIDSASSNDLSRVTWSNVKATIKTYTDTLYNNYSHPTGDGNLHVPATSTTNNGKVLTAGATAGSLSWTTPTVAWANISNKPTSTVANIDSAVTDSHIHSNKALLDSYTQTEANLSSAVSLKHSHSNNALLDSYTQTESDLSSAVSLKHTQNTDSTLTNSGANTIQNTSTGNIVNFKVNTTTKASVDANGKFTGTVDWDKVNNKPSSTVANIDTAVTNSHTHPNQELIDSYTQTDAALAAAVQLGHAQNTDNALTSSGINVINTTGAGNIVDFKVSSTVKASVNSSGKFTGTIDWASINNKPSSTATNIDSAVSNSHTHSNKATLDTYTQTEANLASAVTLKHSQNTDTGTTNATFTVGTSGVKIKNNGGTELQVRNNADSDYANLRVGNLIVEGTTTTINSNTVNIGDSELELNSDITTSANNSDGGIVIKRFSSDDTIRKDAKLTFNNSTGRWQATFGLVTGHVITKDITHKVTATIGDGVATSFMVQHLLNTKDISVTIRQSELPYAIVMADVEITTTDYITIKFAVAPTVGQYSVTIIG